MGQSGRLASRQRRRLIQVNLLVWLQVLLPQQLLSRLAGRLADTRIHWLKNSLIALFIAAFKPDMQEARCTDPYSYPSLGELFTRRLAESARPLPSDPDAVCWPNDGRLQYFGTLTDGQLIEAKGRHYSVRDLLAKETSAFDNGWFCVTYLSPQNYHRIHMPIGGTLSAVRHIPGRLFSVSTRTSEVIGAVPARNERLLCLFETAIGSVALILVGAMMVSEIRTRWGSRQIPAAPLSIARGEEMGHFRFGSTAVMLFPPGQLSPLPGLHEGQRIRIGETLGTITHPGNRQP